MKNLTSFEKVVLGLLAAFAVFCLGYFSSRLYYGLRCNLCRLHLAQGESYILDVRTGEVQPLSQGHLSFHRQASQTARYCPGHTAGLTSDFLVLTPIERATVCYALSDGRTPAPDGRIIILGLNEALDRWELEIRWDIKSSPPSF